MLKHKMLILQNIKILILNSLYRIDNRVKCVMGTQFEKLQHFNCVSCNDKITTAEH